MWLPQPLHVAFWQVGHSIFMHISTTGGGGLVLGSGPGEFGNEIPPCIQMRIISSRGEPRDPVSTTEVDEQPTSTSQDYKQ